MGRFVNPDNRAFQVALNSEIYVDKTGLLNVTNRVLGTKQGYICNSRPRKFGKSYTANMLAAYYSKGCDSDGMFSRFEIGRSKYYRQHLNQYNVIQIDVQWFYSICRNKNKIVSYITESILEELKSGYPEVELEEAISLADGLSRIREKTGQTFIIIVDEWDILIRDKVTNEKLQKEYLNFLSCLFQGSEPRKYIKLAFLIGILPIKGIKALPLLNDFMQYTMLNAGRLAPYIGFTEEEVHQLCEKYGQDFAEVKRWYDGYELGNYHVYSPIVIEGVMEHQEFRNYWSDTGTYKSLIPLINMNLDGLKTEIFKMLSGADVEVQTRFF